MNLREKFKEVEEKGEKALILYISCGDPTAEGTIKIAKEVIKAGCDILELGLPFSDPLADGLIIQEASGRAISAGMNTDKYFDTVKKIEGLPKVCMTYYNLIYQYGPDRFAKACAKSGISGLIVPDLPPEEAGPLQEECSENGVSLIYIVSPKTSRERLVKIKDFIDSSKTRICEPCSKGRGSAGFLYLQSVLGVTGAREEMQLSLKSKIAELKELFGLPVAVGFGVSGPKQAMELAEQGADGIIVGSALVRKINKGEDYTDFVRKLKEASK